ncbi:probable receptor-like protein kinase At1g11050 [Salvia hispanica]|uniref:probable receptor-like protein kinase At1g11050 n=1 Tax=Salvia hispanica TaxID=49212 RepID=UPI002008F146|nr:probable receptor-like protein kinase At1g11050 [Salvia hispanica]
MQNAKTEKIMNILFLIFIFIFVFSFFNFNTAATDASSSSSSSSSCPISFDYVETLPWDASLCRDPIQTSCCQTLRSLFGVGLAQHLNQTSQFYLPTATASSSCIAQFERKISSMSLTRSLLPLCFNDTSEFANTNSSTSCAGITTLQDWDLEADEAALVPLESACSGDLTGLTLCSMCVDAGLKLTSHLVSSHPNSNSTKCFYFTVLYAAGVINGFGPDDIRSAACIFGLPVSRSARSGPASHRTRRFIFGFCGGLVGISGLVILFFIYRKWDRKKKQDVLHRDYVSSVKSIVLPNIGAKFFELRDLEQATDKFAKRNLIGQGGFGAVYRGTLPDDKTEVAVKQIFETDSAESDDDFINEALIISKIRHRNLLPLRGFCVASDRFHGKRRFLVYDYMPNGSLNDHIFIDNNNNDSFLSWPQRKNIILDIAKGLAYLHYGIKPTIYHRDIKATNILLDADMKARVADFGLAKQNLEGQSHLTTRVAGTHGYLAPEYALYGQLTEKSDVYSFGILILEIMSGRRVLDASKSERILITDWAWELVKAGKAEEVFHGGIRREGPKGVMERFVRVGILCAHVMVALRPTIEDALRMLEGDIDIPRLPDRPLSLAQFSSFSYGTSTSEGSRVSNWSNTS